METVIQIILTISVVSLTVIFVTVGIWVILILKEFKGLVGKLKEVGDDISETTSFTKEKIKEGLNLATILAAIGALWSRRERVEGLLLGRDKEAENKEELKKKKQSVKKERRSSSESEEEKSPSASSSKSSSSAKPKRRFFFRRKKA